MTHAVDAGLILEVASWALTLLVGAWIATLAPRRRQTQLLATYFVVHGVAHGVRQLAFGLDLTAGTLGTPGRHVLFTVADVVEPLGHIALVALAAWVPDRLEDRRLLVAALAVGWAFSGTLASLGWIQPPGAPVIESIYIFFSWGLFFAPAVLLALRAAPSRGASVQGTTQLAILALAYPLIGVFRAGAGLAGAAGALARGSPEAFATGTLYAGLWLVTAGLWGWNMLRARTDTLPVHRAAMLGILGTLFAGAVSKVVLPAPFPRVVAGAVNVVSVGLLAYGVLRHDLAGLDAKVEYGVSRTTVAGIFVAVFFVVSEGAQVLFAGFAGSEFLGVLAAGALVFVISPLQRMADRFAAKAVPGGAGAGAGVEGRYRDALETALADGEITVHEERHLGRLAERLGIDRERALEIREQVEDDAGGGSEP